MRFVIIKLLMISMGSLLASCQTTQSKEKEVALRSEKGIIVSYMNSGEHQIALKRLRDSLKQYPKDAELLNLMGLVQLSLKNYTKAIHYLKSSYAQSKKPLVLLNLSSAYIETGRHGEARKLLARMAKDETTNSYNAKERVFHNLAYSYEKTRSYNTAIKIYKKALAENPTYHMSWLQLGRVYKKKKNYREASVALNKAISFCRLCLEPNEDLFHVYVSAGKKDQARKLIKSYLADNSTTPLNKKRARQLLSTLKN